MTLSWLLLAAALGLLLLLPGLWAWRMVALYLPGHDSPDDTDSRLPRALVILPVRGADPSLQSCLIGLLRQNYPSYSVRIIVDSPEDPAWGYLREVLATNPTAEEKVKVAVVNQRRTSCSVKVSAQLQVLSHLDPDVKAVAFIDADCIPGPDWLRSLVAPLADPAVGATTGIRWFVPPDAKWGSWVRHAYNAGSFTQMYAFHCPWGGSMAMRAEVIRHSGILEHWSNCFCEDTSAYTVLRELGLRLVFVPRATQFNRESIDLTGAYQFILRQLLCARLHLVHWPAIAAANLGHTLALLVCVGLLGFDLAQANMARAALWGGLLAGYLAVMTSAFLWGDYLAQSTDRQSSGSPAPALWSWKQLPAAVLAQLLSFYCIIWTHFIRVVRWRGVTYAIAGRHKIRLLEYAAYQGLPTPPGHSVI